MGCQKSLERKRRFRVRGSILVILGTVASATNSWAYRPFDGTDADVARVGEFELELGPVNWYSPG